MDEDLRRLLEENLRLTREVHGIVVKVRRHLLWQRVASVIYLVLIVAPIIIAVLYLPPILKPLWQQYRQILGAFSNTAASGSASPTEALPDLQNFNGLNIQELLDSVTRGAKPR